jgi:hypothetical protein
MSHVAIFPLLLCAAASLGPPPAIKVTPRLIEVGAFYDGAKVRVEGATAPRSGVIVAITGSDREERFKQKVRFGPFWMNASRVRISGAPSLILRFSTGPVAALLDSATISMLHLDEASVTARMHIDTPPGDQASHAALRSAYLALKKSEGIYAFGDGGISTRGPGDDCVPYALEFHWPSKAPPARYTIHVYEVRDKVVIGEASVPLAVVRTGFPAWLAELAQQRAAIYGMTAVLIGALAGFGIDFLTTLIFGKKHKVAH